MHVQPALEGVRCTFDVNGGRYRLGSLSRTKEATHRAAATGSNGTPHVTGTSAGNVAVTRRVALSAWEDRNRRTLVRMKPAKSPNAGRLLLSARVRVSRGSGDIYVVGGGVGSPSAGGSGSGSGSGSGVAVGSASGCSTSTGAVAAGGGAGSDDAGGVTGASVAGSVGSGVGSGAGAGGGGGGVQTGGGGGIGGVRLAHWPG